MTQNPRLLDLFCKAGGSAEGYARAGFEVIGVDIKPQPNYPFEFHQADALNLAAWPSRTVAWIGFDAIHASPPCQKYSHGNAANNTDDYVDLIGPTRELLEAAGLPYVIENVKRAPLVDPITLCGASFGLRAMDAEGNLVLRRHRLFESNVSLVGKPCACRHWQSQGFKIAGCYGGARRTRHEAETIRHGGYVPSKPILENLMGIGWMTEAELFEAIPPAYTEFIGEQLIERLGDR